MKIEKKLKKLGIKEIRNFTMEEKQIVAYNVTDSLIMAFPILQDKRQEIIKKIQSANMSFAKIEYNLPKINYLYNNQKIYFDEKVNINIVTASMIHEIIHFMQDIRKKKNKLDRIGLCNFNELSLHGLGINEGAVQYISAKALSNSVQRINKNEIILKTISPDYYPILTNLIEQIVILIGEDDLVKSIILNEEEFVDLFFNTYEENSKIIINFFDEIINYENHSIKENQIDKIKNIYIQTQDLIMRTFFDKQFKLLETEDDIHNLSNKLEKYVEMTGEVKINNYYYNNSKNYKSHFMNKLDQKLIKLHENRNKMALTIVYSSKINKLLNRIKTIFKPNI